MRSPLPVLLGIVLPCFVLAQAGFQQQYSREEFGAPQGGTPYAVVSTSDGFALGAQAPGSLYGVCLLRTDPSGTPTSVRTYDMSLDGYGQGAITAMVQLPDGGFIVAGAAPQLFFGRINADGSVAWAQSVAGSYNFATEIILTSDGNFVFTGKRQGNAYDAFVIKADLAGGIIWSSFYGSAVENSEFFTSIVETPDGGFLAYGYWNYNLYYMDLLAVKLDAAGGVQWSKRYGPTEVNTYLLSDRISPTADGGYVLTGTKNVYPTNTFEPLVMKIDAAGSVVWSRKWEALTSTSGLGVTNFHVLHRIMPDQSMLVLLGAVGYPSTSMQLVHADATGSPLSSVSIRHLELVERATDMVLLPGGAAALCGYYHTGTYVASSFLITTDAQGNSACNDSASTTAAVNFDLPVEDGGMTASPCAFVYTGLTPAVTDITIDHLNTCAAIGVPEPIELSVNAITVSPSPAADGVRITLASTLPGTALELVDPSGKVVRTVPVNGRASILLERNGLSSGLYLVRWSGSDRGATSVRFMFE